ncbi:MAG TPA: hypothetical protein VFX15_03285 [Actinomycetes bacterium]|nr:hypothetical protein [Actinomycetes bacterium]
MLDLIVERLVRQITAARRRGDDWSEAMFMARLQHAVAQPGGMRALDRALAIVDWRI